jgi:hypothetical protein
MTQLFSFRASRNNVGTSAGRGVILSFVDRFCDRKLELFCVTCDSTVFGGSKGSQDGEAIAKALKQHEDETHNEYESDLRRRLFRVIALINVGVQEQELPGSHFPPIGRYRVKLF